MKKRVEIILLIILLLFLIDLVQTLLYGDTSLYRKSDAPAEYGSFTSKTTVSSDGRYTAKQELVWPWGSEVRMVRVDVYDNNTGDLADSFITERAWDFWGICWEEGSYNFWIQSGDVGVYCFEEVDGKWIKNFDMEKPEDIISKYDLKQNAVSSAEPTLPVPEDKSYFWVCPLPE